ncbi:MAG: helix-turn-helix domain-containing protein [Cyanobacteria bacterium J06631_2]
MYYNRHLSPDEVHTILQSHAEGSSLRGVSRISGRAYGTVVSLVRDAAQKSQMVHNAEVEQVTTEEIIGDEMS